MAPTNRSAFRNAFIYDSKNVAAQSSEVAGPQKGLRMLISILW